MSHACAQHARWVSGILWVPVRPAAAEMVPGQAPHSLLLSPGAQEGTPTPHPRVQGLGWEVRWAVAPGSTAVWLPGLGDRWPQHSRLCLPSIHAHLSSVSWGAGGWGLPLHPPLSPGQSAALRGAPSPFLVPAPSSQSLTRLGAPSPPRCRHPQTAPLISAYPTFHVLALTMLTPSQRPLRMDSLFYRSGRPHLGGAHPVFESGRHDCLPCAEPEGQQGENLLSVAARLPSPPAESTGHP